MQNLCKLFLFSFMLFLDIFTWLATKSSTSYVSQLSFMPRKHIKEFRYSWLHCLTFSRIINWIFVDLANQIQVTKVALEFPKWVVNMKHRDLPQEKSNYMLQFNLLVVRKILLGINWSHRVRAAELVAYWSKIQKLKQISAVETTESCVQVQHFDSICIWYG